MLSTFLLILLTVVVALIFLAYRYHVFTPISVKSEYIAPVKIVYTTFIGPYKEAWKPSMQLLNEKLPDDFKPQCPGATKFIGIYYDDPKITKPEDCRSVIGFVVDDDFKLKNDADGKIHIDTIEIGEAACVHFPFYSMIDVLVGVMRCYPLLGKWFYKNHKNAFPNAFVEFYGFLPNTLSFTGPIGARTGLLNEFPK